jgi:hypothetical protein
VWRALDQLGAMVEVPDDASDPADADLPPEPQVAAMDGGARWHPSSPRVSPRIPSALPGTLVSVEALVIDCVMGWTTSSEGETW